MKFLGKVSSRSSRSITGPPGESEIQRLNPQRTEKILQATGWESLAEGSLNLEVTENIVINLGKLEPLIREDWRNVKYPRGFENIPIIRKGYLYYSGVACKGKSNAPVLVRRAVNPLPTRVELFSPFKLRDDLQLNDGDSIEVQL